MIFFKSILAGIGGSILALILLIAATVILNLLNVSKNGMVGINVIAPLPLGLVALGFVFGFYLVFRTSH